MSEIKVPKKLQSGIITMLENFIVSQMMESKIPSSSFAVVAGENVIYAKTFGARDLEKNIPATVNTMYGFGSATKSYTALAIMLLIQEGKLSVRDQVKKYVDLKLRKKSNPITIHQLLTHSTGIPNLGMGEVLSALYSGLDHGFIPLSSWEDYYSYINGATQWVMPEPGQKFFYSNESYTILGDIVARVSNMKFEEFIKTRIFTPLNMNNSIFTREEFKNHVDVMTPYYAKVEKGKIIEATASSHPFDKFVYAPGGLISSVMDQVNYLKFYLNEGMFEGQQILDKPLLREMLKPHIKTDLVKNAIGGFENVSYGYGWIIIEDFFGEQLIIHPGSTDSSNAALAFLPKRKVGIACACNSGAGFNLMAMFSLFLSTILVGKNPMEDLTFAKAEQKLAMLTGVYETYKGFYRVKLVKTGAFLFIESDEGIVDFNAGLSIPLIPEREDLEDFKFYTLSGAGGKTTIEFHVESDGNIDFFMERNRFRKVGELTR